MPWESEAGRRFSNEIDEDVLRKSIDQIKIIHEDIGGRDVDFAKAKQLLEWVEKYISWGSVSNKLNVKRLGIASLQPNKSLATAFSLKSNEVQYISKITNGKIVSLTTIV